MPIISAALRSITIGGNTYRRRIVVLSGKRSVTLNNPVIPANIGFVAGESRAIDRGETPGFHPLSACETTGDALYLFYGEQRRRAAIPGVREDTAGHIHRFAALGFEASGINRRLHIQAEGNFMRQLGVIIFLLAALCLPMACSDRCTEPNNTVIPVDTLVMRDIDYLPRTIYDLGRLPLRRAASDSFPEPDKYDFAFAVDDIGVDGDSIIGAIVYQATAYADDLSGDAAKRRALRVGRCYIDPDDTLSDDPDGVYRTNGNFDIVDPAYYHIDPSRFYIEFFQPIVGRDDILAVYMEVLRRRQNGIWIDTVGDVSSDTMKLKLIKPAAYLDVNHHVWEYEWRNIYFLGRTNIDIRNLDLDIYHGRPVNNQTIYPSDLNYNQDGIEYIQILGLDRGDINGIGIPDGEIDKNICIDQGLGFLIFPSRHPFDDWYSYVNDAHGDPVILDDSVPEIYLNTSRQVLFTASRYYMGILYRRP